MLVTILRRIFIFQFAIQTNKGQNIQNCLLACCFTQLGSMVFQKEGGA